MMTHIGSGWALGLSNGEVDSMTELMREMMWPYQSGLGRSFWGFHWVLEFITWVLIIALLVAAIRYLWKLGDKK